MYRILLVSDSHGLTEELVKIRKRHDVHYLFHAGDSELDTDSPSLAGYYVVRGNCDWKGKFPNMIVEEINGTRFMMTHGHLHDVKGSLLKLQYAAEEQEADIICSGHSHIAKCDLIEGKLYINPGSIRLPRHYPEPSYAIVEWDDNLDISVTYYNLQGEKLTDLGGQFKL
ncbi:MAG TPA: metallophosphoesterase [Pseudogracilibacillus sp.]|nr:metallophosphoesterase [Pseudogracilibacillus sp.]